MDHTAKATEGALLYLDDVTALQVEVGQVRCVHKCTPDYHLQVIIPQVQFQCNLEELLNNHVSEEEATHNIKKTRLKSEAGAGIPHLIHSQWYLCQVFTHARHCEFAVVTDALFGTFSFFNR